MIISQLLWLQLGLVGTGAILQVIAMCTFSRDPDIHGGVPSRPEQDTGSHTDGKTPLPATTSPAMLYRPQVSRAPQDSFADLHPASLAKTKKVSFRQDFRGLH